MRTRLRLQEVSYTKDTYGESDASWTHIAKVWGHVRPFTGREMFEAQATVTEVTDEVTVRYRKFLHANKRFLKPMEFTSLSAAITADDQTTLALADTGVFMGVSGKEFIIEIGSEQIIVTYVESTDTATMTTRGAFGTTAGTHVINSLVTRLAPLEIVAVMDIDDRREMFKLACKESVI
jgi:SPP1 family predicted phage head-tail adaptor